MAGLFDDVIRGIGMRFGEVSDDHFVDAIGRIFLVRLNQFSENRASGFEFMLQLEHREGNRAGIWSRKADDADSAAARRSGDGHDSVVEVHWEILMVVAPRAAQR